MLGLAGLGRGLKRDVVADEGNDGVHLLLVGEVPLPSELRVVRAVRLGVDDFEGARDAARRLAADDDAGDGGLDRAARAIEVAVVASPTAVRDPHVALLLWLARFTAHGCGSSGAVSLHACRRRAQHNGSLAGGRTTRFGNSIRSGAISFFALLSVFI